MLRQAFRHPIQVLVQVLSLGIGLAVCLTAWSTVDALSFSPVPGIHDRAALVRVRWASGQPLLSARELSAGRARLDDALGPLAVEGNLTKAAETPVGAATLGLAFVSDAYFETLGTTPLAGQVLSPANISSPSAPPVVVSDSLWQTAFGRRPIDGTQTLRIVGQAVTVIGVAPPGFPGLATQDVVPDGASPIDVWLPIAAASAWGIAPARDSPWLMLAGRPAHGHSLASARAEATSAAAPMAAASHPRRDPILYVYPSGIDWSEDLLRASLVVGLFLALPLCILGIGCANTINLQLARAHERSGELAIRAALGSSRGRLVRMMALDTVVVAGLSALTSVVVTRAIVTWSEGALQLPLVMHVSSYVFAAVLAAAITVLAGVVPAWIATRDIVMPGARTLTAEGVRHQRLRLGLVIVQVIVCTALLFVSAVGVRSLARLVPTAGPAADRTAVLAVHLDEIHPGQPRSALFTMSVLSRLTNEPGIEAVGFADFSPQARYVSYAAPGDASTPRRVLGGFVSPNWPAAMGLPLLSGRGLSDDGGPDVALVNRQLAAHLAAGQTDLLVTATPGGVPMQVSVVGVVDTPGFQPDTPMLFLRMPGTPPASITIVTRGESVSVARAALRNAVVAVDPLVPVDRIDTLASVVERESGGFDRIVSVGSVVSLAALLIAAAGIYSLMAYSVQRRTRELGIRMAIGASRPAILRLVCREAMWVYAVGAGVGLMIGMGVATLMRAAFFGLSPLDPLTFWPIAVGLLVVTILASSAPALAATRIDPLASVRSD
jgi:predicted permease